MPGETIEHPVPGWNELPREPGQYAWWDGQRFTTIAFRTDDHWEYVADQVQAGPAIVTTPPKNRAAWIALWLGVANALTLFVLGPFLGPIGVVVAVVALRAPLEKRERRAAIAGLVVGCISVLPGVILLGLRG